LTVGDSLLLVATVVADSGVARAVTWSSSNTAVAGVGASGIVRCLTAGSATITAASTTDPTKAGTATITVLAPAPVATVGVTVTAPMLASGQVARATAVLHDGVGRILTGRSIQWATSNSAVASVGADGSIAALSAGVASITATSEGRSGSASLTILQAAPVL